MQRRQLLKLASALPAVSLAQANPRYKISLAQWSLHRAIRQRLMTNLDFPQVAREQFGIGGLEFVNALWEVPTASYLTRLKANMKKFDTQGVLIMCDAEGMMGHSVEAERMKAAHNHHKWVEFAAELGCHAIRTNMYPEKQPQSPAEVDEFLKHCAQSFTALCTFAKTHNINVLIENHGGISSQPEVVARLMKMVNLPNFGTLPDFGNFPKEMNKYEAVEKLMPFAKGVSFKCWEFGPDGKETTLDMDRMMSIVNASAYRGYVGIEYEGEKQSEFIGIQGAKRFLDRYAK